MAIAPFPLVLNDIVELNTYTYLSDQVGINRSYFKVQLVVVAGVVLQDIADFFDALVGPLYKAVLASNALYVGVNCRVCHPALRRSNYFQAIATAGVGTAGAVALPRQSAGMFTKTTASPGAAGRGRMYVSFPAADDSETLGRPTAGYMTRLGALAVPYTSPQVIVNGGASLDLVPVLFRPARPSATPPVAALVGPQVMGATARRKWATHRTRGTYGRANALPLS